MTLQQIQQNEEEQAENEGVEISGFKHEYNFKTDRILEIPEEIRKQAIIRGISGEELKSYMVRIRRKISGAQRANSTEIPYRLVGTAEGTIGTNCVIIDLCGFCAHLAFAAYDVIHEDLLDHD